MNKQTEKWRKFLDWLLLNGIQKWDGQVYQEIFNTIGQACDRIDELEKQMPFKCAYEENFPVNDGRCIEKFNELEARLKDALAVIDAAQATIDPFYKSADYWAKVAVLKSELEAFKKVRGE